MKAQKGFTLIELIVVIAIIGILAGIVLVNVNTYITKTKMARVQEEMSNIGRAFTSYYVEYGEFPGQQLCEDRYGDCTLLDWTFGTDEMWGTGTDFNNEMSGIYNFNLNTAANFWNSEAYYQIDVFDEDGDGKLGCSYTQFVTSTVTIYKFTNCDDCSAYCGVQGVIGST